MKKDKSGSYTFVIVVALAVLSLSLGTLFYVFYFAWDSQIEADTYKTVFEKNGQLYDLRLQTSGLAFDSGTNDDHLYTKHPHQLGELIALAHQDERIRKADNPFFAGEISANNTSKYFEQETKYSTPTDSSQSYKFYDKNRNQIFVYEPGTENEYVIKIRPTFPSFSKSRVSIGNKFEYLNATKILREKFSKNLKIKIDEANKLLTLHFEN